MTNFKDVVTPKPKNITDLEAVSVEQEVFYEERENQEGKKYDFHYILVDDTEYRVPVSVINQIQAIMKSSPVKTFKVIKTGEGMQTKYSIQVLE